MWAGQTISFFGNWLGALSLLAIVVLGAAPAQMGLLETLKTLPAVMLGLFPGCGWTGCVVAPCWCWPMPGGRCCCWRWPRPHTLHLLHINHLYLVVLVIGNLTVLYNIANDAYVPSVVRRGRLVEANSTLSASESVAESIRRGWVGCWCNGCRAPLTLLLDGLSYLASAVLIGSIKVQEVAAAPYDDEPNVYQEIRAGLRQLWGNEWLRAAHRLYRNLCFFLVAFTPPCTPLCHQPIGAVPGSSRHFDWHGG